ncbi:MAG: hypothetical protein KAK00_00270 [Nanoarchaeota archaeon]|nr:hypothetical protein [Nanoarchaeota archaeon]
MFEGIWTIVEMRGPSIVSLLGIFFLSYLYFSQNKNIKKLNDELESAKESIYNKFGKILENTSNNMTMIKTDVGKQTESIKGICKTLDNVQKDIRQMRELK